MTRLSSILALTLASALLCCWWGCVRDDGGESGNGSDGDSDGDADGDGDSDADPPPGLTAVDIVLAVDNSGSMGEEQQILQAQIGILIDALLEPSGELDDVRDIRVGVVSSDMGLSWGGNPYEDGDGWPGTPPCTATGDNGQFQPSGDWSESTAGDPNPDLADEIAACVDGLGTGGCGWEQQLESLTRGIERSDQADFLRPEALLALVVISDEEDCSMEDNALFAVDEIQDLGDGRVNVACGNHPEFLYPVSSYASRWAAAKDGELGAVVFAAIAGVPIDDACEGRGNEIGNCLEHPDMELDIVMEGEPPAYFFRPACTRVESDTEVTKARPGRRYVEIAQSLGSAGYTYSICNEGWTSALDELAVMIAERIGLEE